VSMESPGVRGGRPDLASSPEVLTWRRTLSCVGLSEGRAFCRAVAALDDASVWIVWRFGMASEWQIIKLN
jgi:hypothetical protein